MELTGESGGRREEPDWREAELHACGDISLPASHKYVAAGSQDGLPEAEAIFVAHPPSAHPQTALVPQRGAKRPRGIKRRGNHPK